MDFAAHYAQPNEFECLQREFTLHHHNFMAELINRCLPEIIDHIHRQPPTECNHIWRNGRQVVAWRLGEAYYDNNDLYLLPDGTIVADHDSKRVVAPHTFGTWEEFNQDHAHEREVPEVFKGLFGPDNRFRAPVCTAVWAQARHFVDEHRVRGQFHRYWVNDRYNGVDLQPVWLRKVMRAAIDNLESFNWCRDRFEGGTRRWFADDIGLVHSRSVRHLWLLRFGGIVDSKGDRVDVGTLTPEEAEGIAYDLVALANLYKSQSIDYRVDVPGLPQPQPQPKHRRWFEILEEFLGL